MQERTLFLITLNLGLNEPHKIIINNTQSLVLLCYDNNSNLYNEDLSDTITITELTQIINTLFNKECLTLLLINA